MTQKVGQPQLILRLPLHSNPRVVWPDNGDTSFLRILFGENTDQIHINIKAARQLRDELNRALGPSEEK